MSAEKSEAALPAAKPPFLQRVRIRNYKSIAFCDVSLEPLTILVGRNGSGKSNFVDALAFLRDALDGGVNSALEAHGGLSLFSKFSRSTRVVIHIDAEFPSYRMKCQASYRVELALNQRRQLEVEEETLAIEDVMSRLACSFKASRGHVAWHGIEQFHNHRLKTLSEHGRISDWPEVAQYPLLGTHYRPDHLLLGVLASQPFTDLSLRLQSLSLHNFNPEAMRQPQPNAGSPALESDGRNLARAIEGLREIAEEDVARVTSYLRAIVPGIVAFDVVPAADRETIRFTVEGVNGTPPVELYAGSMSDGTLRALAALVAAYQIHLPIGPGMVGIEEPETALHPAAMDALVEALIAATERTQILLTTHSPDLLDVEGVGPANIRVVQMIDGHTVIGRVDEASAEIARKELNTLAGMERHDQLEVHYDDLEQVRRELGQPAGAAP